MKSKLLFFGTPDFAVPFLDTLATSNDFEVALVVTQPDKPKGRSGTLQPTPIHVRAKQLGIPVATFPSLKKNAAQKEHSTIDASCYVVVAYGNILPQEVIAIPQYGCINVHFSLLPKYRGPTPIEQAILDGVTETGVTFMLLDEGLDTGPIIAQKKIPINSRDTTTTLRRKLVEVSCRELTPILTKWLSGELKAFAQDERFATKTKLLSKKDGRIDWKKDDAVHVDRMIRAYYVWPGTFTLWNKKVVKIIAAHAILETHGSPGEVIAVDKDFGIGTSAGTLILETVQLEGSKPTNIHEFVRGHQTFIGSRLS